MSSLLLRRALPRGSARAFSTSSTRSSFAKMTLIGRLADTPELQATSTGEELLRYAIGVNSGPKDNQKTSWFKVTSFLPDGPQRSFIAGLDKGFVFFLSQYMLGLHDRLLCHDFGDGYRYEEASLIAV